MARFCVAYKRPYTPRLQLVANKALSEYENPSMSDKTPGERALDLLALLVKRGTWYYSAIEITPVEEELNGEELFEQATAILLDAGIIPEI